MTPFYVDGEEQGSFKSGGGLTWIQMLGLHLKQTVLAQDQ